MKAIGHNIRQYRKYKGITQEDLAKLSGLSTMSIRRYESGERVISSASLERISAALNISVDHLTAEIKTVEIPMPDYPVRMPSPEEFEKMSSVEQEYFSLRMLADTDPDLLKKQLDECYRQFNKLGCVEVVRRAKELAKLPEYTEPDSNNKSPKITMHLLGVHGDSPQVEPSGPQSPTPAENGTEAPETGKK